MRSGMSMATRGLDGGPAVLSVFFESGVNGGDKRLERGEIVRGFSWHSKLREGGRGEARRRPRRLLGHAGHAALCLAAWGRRQGEGVGWAGWAVA